MDEPDALVVTDSVPQAVPVHPAPDSVHVTPLFCASFCTVALIACVAAVCTVAAVGLTLIDTAGTAITVMVAAAVLLVSVTDLAVRVTVAGVGIFAGAV